MVDITSELFNPGAIKEREDARDFQWNEVGRALPAFNWNIGYSVMDEVRASVGMPQFNFPAKDQGFSGSCGGQAWAYYGAALESVVSQTYEERSAKFIYSQTYVNQPGGGSDGRSNSKIVIKQGWGLEADTPSYDNGMAPSETFMRQNRDISDAARGRAKLATALSYANTGTKIDDIAQAIQHNKGTIIGITGSNNGTWLSTRPAPPKNGEKFWHHWVWCGEARMVDGRKAIRILNSWGKDAGENGWQWVDENYFLSDINDYYGEHPIWSGWTLLYNITAPPPMVYKHHFGLNMQFGDTNEEVKALQTALTITGDFPSAVKPTAYYGNITAAAVFKFQQRVGISPPNRDHAGPKTRAELNKIFDR